MRILAAVGVLVMLTGCAGRESPGGEVGGPAPLRGFGVQVDQAVSARIPVVHVKTCGSWGCHEQDVPLSISGPTSAAPCSGQPPDAACGVVHLPGPGPGYGYAPVPGLTQEPVTVTVTTPRGAPVRVNARLRVQPRLVCPGGGAPGGTGASQPAGTCAGGAPQAQLRIAADGAVSQSR